MEILHEIKDLQKNTAISLGFFDGLHIGHAKLITQLVLDSKEKGLTSLVYTFKNHPLEFTSSDKAPTIIFELEQKIDFIKDLGVDILVMLDFDDFQRNIDPEIFLKQILVDKLNMKHLVVGYDFRFGKKAKGNAELMIQRSKNYGYSYDIVDPIKKGFVRVSSTLIRKLLNSGNIKDANFYLGRNYHIVGKVIDGKKIGRKIGFPTANLELDDNFAILKPGVYITKTYINNTEFYSVTNVGFNPTFESGGFSAETHIINFKKNIYGKKITIEFFKRIRNEIKFKNIDNLKESIKWDIFNTKKYFNLE